MIDRRDLISVGAFLLVSISFFPGNVFAFGSKRNEKSFHAPSYKFRDLIIREENPDSCVEEIQDAIHEGFDFSFPRSELLLVLEKGISRPQWLFHYTSSKELANLPPVLVSLEKNRNFSSWDFLGVGWYFSPDATLYWGRGYGNYIYAVKISPKAQISRFGSWWVLVHNKVQTAWKRFKVCYDSSEKAYLEEGGLFTNFVAQENQIDISNNGEILGDFVLLNPEVINEYHSAQVKTKEDLDRFLLTHVF